MWCSTYRPQGCEMHNSKLTRHEALTKSLLTSTNFTGLCLKFYESWCVVKFLSGLIFKGLGLASHMHVWKHCLFPCFRTNLIFIASACSHCARSIVHQHGDWPEVSPRKGLREAEHSHGAGCSARMERFMPELLKISSWCCFWCCHNSQKRGISPKERWEHSRI